MHKMLNVNNRLKVNKIHISIFICLTNGIVIKTNGVVIKMGDLILCIRKSQLHHFL
jgi:hypothetical protein